LKTIFERKNENGKERVVIVVLNQFDVLRGHG
jgi:hypothetical protein